MDREELLLYYKIFRIALLVVALHLFRRRSRSRAVHSDERYPLPTLPLAAAPIPASVPAAPHAIVEQQGPHLRWGPVQDDLAPPPAVDGTAAQLRRSPARPLPSRPTGDSRP